MDHKFEYSSNEERQQLIDEHTNLVLVEEQNITEGNFLIFADEPRYRPDPIDQRMTELSENQLILMDALATMYEDMLAKGTV